MHFGIGACFPCEVTLLALFWVTNGNEHDCFWGWKENDATSYSGSCTQQWRNKILNTPGNKCILKEKALCISINRRIRSCECIRCVAFFTGKSIQLKDEKKCSKEPQNVCFWTSMMHELLFFCLKLMKKWCYFCAFKVASFLSAMSKPEDSVCVTNVTLGGKWSHRSRRKRDTDFKFFLETLLFIVHQYIPNMES